MTYKPDDHSVAKARELAFLVEALGIDELYERVDALDSKGGLPEAGPWNPTEDPMVVKTHQGEVGTLSGGPREENVGDLSVIDPDHVKRIEALAAEQEALADEREETEEEEQVEETEETESVYRP